jgi:hypothetical protein
MFEQMKSWFVSVAPGKLKSAVDARLKLFSISVATLRSFDNNENETSQSEYRNHPICALSFVTDSHRRQRPILLFMINVKLPLFPPRNSTTYSGLPLTSAAERRPRRKRIPKVNSASSQRLHTAARNSGLSSKPAAKFRNPRLQAVHGILGTPNRSGQYGKLGVLKPSCRPKPKPGLLSWPNSRIHDWWRPRARL